MELAQLVIDEQARHSWFQDQLTLDKCHEPLFGHADIDEARALRRHLSRDLVYDVETLPDSTKLPEVARIVAAQGELARVDEIERAAQAGNIPYMNPDLETARRLRDWVVVHKGYMTAVKREQWLFDAFHALLGIRPLDPAPLRGLRETFAAWSDLHRRGYEFGQKLVFCDHGDDPAFDRALDDLSDGRNPFGVFSLFKRTTKAKIDGCSIEGRHPATMEDWAVIRSYRGWQQEGQRFVARWAGIARPLSYPCLPSEWDVARDELLRLGSLVERLSRLLDRPDLYRDTIRTVFPYGIDADDVLHNGRCEELLHSLDANLEKAELATAVGTRSGLRTFAGDSALPVYAAVREFCDHLGDPDVSQSAAVEAWQGIISEARRLDHLRPDFHRLNEIAAKVAKSGAQIWSGQLRSASSTDDDPWTRSDWRASWDWACAAGFLRSFGDRGTVRRLSDSRAAAEADQRKLFADVVRLRTFLGLKRTLSQRVEAALAKFTSAISRLGKGTGKAANRHRRIIREAAMEAAQAVPCWILPEWRVAEQLPAELAAFDLVIIDEASQSDITALPAIMRGKKALIVGDDKQVSPTPVGIEDRKIIQLRTTFLTDLPFADQMDPGTSLYELGGMIFPGNAIILREHFRCVEPIIRFSSRFYDKSLIPLRVPTASERLDPPLIDIYVPFGKKVREINEVEAGVIVREIGKLVMNPALATRSIGVILLIGNTQANLIYTRLIAELGTDVVEKHRIMCGNAATFQGQERDIVFLSMVACPATTKALTARLYEQRFNVAASRARDRLVLVRSVAASDLNPGDLKLALIEHFRDPMKAGNVIKPREVLDLCQSDFERDFGRCILDLGYRVRPQVPVGTYSIDFVIEGADDRRLAIELDGDKYHGPDKWADDVRRQRALERLGWVFWRCWGSAWIADRDICIADLKVTLQRLGIEPIGMSEVSGVFTEHIEIAPSDFVQPEPVIEQSAESSDQTVVLLKNEIRARDAAIPAGQVDVATSSIFTDLNGITAEVGDLVFVRYEDQPERRFSIRLSDTMNKPEDGLVHIAEPLGEAVLGASVDEQVEVTIGSTIRFAIVEKIEKGRESDMLTAAD